MPENRGRVVAGMLSLALPLLVLWRCAAQPEPPPVAATTVARASASPPSPPLDAAPATAQQVNAIDAADVANDDSAPASGATPPPVASLAAPSPSASSSTAAGIIAAVARRDPRDLALLSRIERELKRDPPPAVHGLIRMREAGASRRELLAAADKQLGSDLALRVIVRRWIDEAAPGTAASPQSLGPTQGGGHAPLIKPIAPAKAP